MVGDGCRVYWGRKETEGVNGVIVILAWISSEEKDIERYVRLYASVGWNSLVFHTQNCYELFPEEAIGQIFGLVDELLKEVKIRPLPIVFAAFSGGPNAFLFKLLKIIEESCEVQANLEEHQLVRDCICGHIYDSVHQITTSDSGIQVSLYPPGFKIPQLSRVVSWVTKAIASGVDAFFPRSVEAQNAEFWQTLCSAARTGPCLIFCSEDDNPAPCRNIYNLAQRLHDFGGDVKLVKLSGSYHLGHKSRSSANYKAEITELLEKASTVYIQRMQKFQRDTCGMGRSFGGLHNVEVNPRQGLGRVLIDPDDHLLLPSPEKSDEVKDMGSAQDKCSDKWVQLQEQRSINAHSVLGQILFDVCVPKNVEDWDIKPIGSTFRSSRRHSPFNPIKCIRRSRL